MAGSSGADPDKAIRVTLPEAEAEIVGAILMDRLGPFSQEDTPHSPGGPSARLVVLTFYPEAAGLPPVTPEHVRALLPAQFPTSGQAAEPDAAELAWAEPPAATGTARGARTSPALVEVSEVGRDWEEGWKEHFHPVIIGRVRIRPPWEARDLGAGLVDVVINPGLGFGTGLHPTTRGTLNLLQEGRVAGATALAAAQDGPLVDVGVGSGVLAIAAAKLGWSPIIAIDNDPMALLAAAENIETNEVGAIVELREVDVSRADPEWFEQATVLANMTLEPVTTLLRRLAVKSGRGPTRLVVSGILAGEQERELVAGARTCGFFPGRAEYESEWVSLELFATRGG
jgi:ribosomal protein L11 methyltransferase